MGAAVHQFSDLNDAHRRDGWPDANTEYLIYQILVGAWPLDEQRLSAFVTKATREAKVHTSWQHPDEQYEEALGGFVRDALGDAGFVRALEGFMAANRIVERGRSASLAQFTLLLTCPGVADLYQGNELWDLSLVDPDNRRGVDYERRRWMLEHMPDSAPSVPLADDAVGVWKLWVVSRLLRHRRDNPELYLSPDYEPLPVHGTAGQQAVAFRRATIVVVVPRLIGGFDGAWPAAWVTLPSGRWKHLLTARAWDGGDVALSDLMHGCPVAVLEWVRQ